MRKKFYQNPAVLFFGGALILVIVLVAIQRYPATSGQYDTLAQCLTEKGVKMYGAFWCPHCKEQKEAFGRSFKYVTYIECAIGQTGQTEECRQAGIQGYPTWEFSDGTRLEGEIALSTLADRSGCPLTAPTPAQ